MLELDLYDKLGQTIVTRITIPDSERTLPDVVIWKGRYFCLKVDDCREKYIEAAYVYSVPFPKRCG